MARRAALVLFMRAVARGGELCDVQTCSRDTDGKVTLERDRIDCVSYRVFRDAPPKTQRGEVAGDDQGIIIYKNGQGWGNCINGLYTIFPFAAALGRRVIIDISYYRMCFLPSDHGSPEWAHVPQWPLATRSKHEKNSTMLFHDIEYAVQRQQSGVDVWNARLRNEELVYAEHTQEPQNVYCNGPNFWLNSCLNSTFRGRAHNPSCPSNEGVDSVAKAAVLPAVVHRPSLVLQSALSDIRERLGLPMAPPNTEPRPGSSGIRSPGTYILALHFRAIPQGFEGVANNPSVRQAVPHFDPFIDAAAIVAEAAAEIATCRGLKLLIYFATDHARALRKPAEDRLRQYGRVLFGLKETEVGHVAPIFSEADRAEIEQIRATCEDVEGPVTTSRRLSFDSCHFLAEPANSDDEKKLHQVFGMAEWWILAQSNWLMASGYSTYADTAANVGLGTHGIMERYSHLGAKVNGSGTMFLIDDIRPNFNADGLCTDHVEVTCPNNGAPRREAR